MKKYLLLVALLPLIAIAQKSKTTVKNKTTAVKKNELQITPLRPEGGFLIIGNVKGYADGTPVALLNPNTGAHESSGLIEKNRFTLTGKMMFPDFKLLLIDNKPPYLNIFLDNSLVNIKVKTDTFENSIITGSPSHDEFVEYNNIAKPNMGLFQEGSNDPEGKKKVSKLLTDYIKKYPNSYVTPLAIYRNFQLTNDIDKLEEQFNALAVQPKSGPIGSYIGQQMMEAKKNPIGKPLADFSQEDSTGKLVSLSSLRGKYVLVDFWASWCGPCRQENPNVVANYHKYKNKNFTVLGVSFDKTKAPWLEAIRMDGLLWTHVSDLQGWANAVGKQFQIQSIPQNFLVDPNGILIAKNLRGPALEAKLASLLGN